MSGEDEQVDTQLSPLWRYVHPRYGIEDDDDDDESERSSSSSGDDDAATAAHAGAGTASKQRQRREAERAALSGRGRPLDYVKLDKRAPRVGALLRYLNDMEEDEELQQVVLEKDPVTGLTLLQWATTNGHYMLVTYLVKRLRRAAFAFDAESPDMVVFTRWEEMRPELPAAADVLERQRQREVARAARLAARRQQQQQQQFRDDDDGDGDDVGDDDNDEEEEEEAEPMPEELVYDALEEYHEQWGGRGIGLVRRIGELGVYAGPRLRDGTKQGVGQSLYANGDCYAGVYADNKREGRGTYWWAKASAVYCGEWRGNVRHGYGYMAYADGSHYLGSWRNNRKHGSGRYVYADGSTYDGVWVNDAKHGTGTYAFTDGSVYHGSFVHNAFVAGEWRLACGTVRYIGNFDTEEEDGGGGNGGGAGAPPRCRAYTRDIPTGAGVFVYRCGGVDGGAGGQESEQQSPQQRYLQEGVYVKGRWLPGVLRGTVGGAAQVHALIAPPTATAAAVATPPRPVRVPLVYQVRPTAPHDETQPRLRVDDLVRVANFDPLVRWLRAVLFAAPATSTPAVRVERVDVLRVRYDAADAHRLVRVWTRPLLLDANGKRVRRLDVAVAASAADMDMDSDAATLSVHGAADDGACGPTAAPAGPATTWSDANDVNDDVVVFAATVTRLLVVLTAQANDARTPPVVLLVKQQQQQQQQQRQQQREGDGVTYTLPTVSVSSDGVVHGDVVERVARTLRLSLSHTRHTLVLMQPALYTTERRGEQRAAAEQQRVLVYIQQLHHDALATLASKLQSLPPYAAGDGDDAGAQTTAPAMEYVAMPLERAMQTSCDAATAAAFAVWRRRQSEQRLPLCTVPPQRPPTPLPPPPQPRPDLQPLYTAQAARDEANEDA